MSSRVSPIIDVSYTNAGSVSRRTRDIQFIRYARPSFVRVDIRFCLLRINSKATRLISNQEEDSITEFP